MTKTFDLDIVIPTATPSEHEQLAWDSLSRDEQLERMRAALTSSEALTPTKTTVAEIWAEVEAEFKARG